MCEPTFSTRTSALRIAFAAALAAGALAARAQAPALPPALDATVERAMATFKVPGVALAIVKDGQVVVAKGYGVRALGRPGRVDGETVLPIASNSKAFTAVALALLVEDRRLEWDAPVARYLPWFRLHDEYASRALTVKDLLVHRSGLGTGAGDLLLFPPTTYTRNEIARRLAHLPAAGSFRGDYAYDNVLYVVAAELVEAVAGRTWERFVQERIFRALGMEASFTGPAGAKEASNAVTPHAELEGGVRAIPPLESEAANPSGGIHATAQDMAKWVRVLLAGGRLPGGGRLYGEETAKALFTLVTPMPIGRVREGLEPLAVQFRGYGLGFIVQDYRGRKVAWHTGGLPGTVSRVTLFPGEGLGIVVLTNQESAEAFNAITYAIADHYLGAPPFDWVAAFDKVRTTTGAGGGATAGATGQAAPAKDPAARAALPAERYEGLYRDPWYGEVEVTRAGSKLAVRFRHSPLLEGPLEHWQHDTFVARWKDRTLRADAYVSFELDPEGRVTGARMKPVSDDTDFSFDFHDLRLRRVAPGP